MARRAWSARCPRGGTATSTATARGSRARASTWIVVGTVSRSTIWGPAGNDHQVGRPGGLERGRFRPRRRIENNGGHALGASRIEGRPEPRRRDVGNDGERGLPAIAPTAGRGLRVEDDRAHLDGQRRRQRRLSGAALR